MLKIPFKRYESIYDIIARILDTPNGITYMRQVMLTNRINYNELSKIFKYIIEQDFIRPADKSELPRDFGRTNGKYYVVTHKGDVYVERYKKLINLL